jgi:Tol biopolymer transport system component
MVLALLIVAIGMVIFAWNSKPNLVETYPLKGESGMPATTAIRLTFSNRMQQNSVIQRLKIDPDIKGSFTWDQNILTFTPEQPWPAGSTISLTLQPGARASGWLSFPMGGDRWFFSVNQAMLAYLWPSDGSADIYALTPSTGVIMRYTDRMGVLDFTVSADGIELYFSAKNSSGGTSLYQIDRTQVLSSSETTYQPKELLDCGKAQCRSPAVSADNQYLAYEYILPDPSGGSGPAQIWRLNLATMATDAIGSEGHETVQPSWSSKEWIAYYDITSSGYVVTNLNTQERTLLPNQTGQPGEWNPAGDYYLAPEIYYYQAPGETERGTSHLIRYGIPSRTMEDISMSLDVEDAEAIYSPDGRFIAFARKFLDEAHWTLGRQLWIMNADGSNAHQITNEADFNHYDLAWSRDGQALAYVQFDESKPFNPPELWMINVDGRNPIQLVIKGYSPIWIP